MNWLPFNINDLVRVKVTQAGFAILRQHDSQWNAAPHRARLVLAENATRIQREQEANGGWSEWQMWDLMKTFGPRMYMGFDPPFETTIELRQANPAMLTDSEEGKAIGSADRSSSSRVGDGRPTT